MPILEQGYEPYKGRIGRTRPGFLPIALAAIRRNNRWWVWALLVVSLFFGSIKEYFLVFMVYVPTALFNTDPSNIPPFFKALAEHPRFYTDMMSTQAFWAIVMAVTVGAGEIAEDLRTGALTFYLGRPVTRGDYILGKAAAVSFVVFLVTLAPLLVLFSAQALFEGEWSWLRAHRMVPFAALGFTLLVCAFTTGVVFGITALTRRRLWATVTIAGALLALSVSSAVLATPLAWTSDAEQRRLHEMLEKAKTAEERRAAFAANADAFDDLGSASETAGWKVLSPLASLSAAARDLFGNDLPGNFSHGRHWFLVLGLPALFYGLFLRRVRAVEVVT
jgi:hypothetical protein